MRRINEEVLEQAAAELFIAAGFRVADGRDLSPETAPSERPEFTQTILAGQLALAVGRLNPTLGPAEVEQVVRAVLRPPHPALVENNRWLHALLTDGVEVEYREPRTGETSGGRARLIDFDDPAANDFLAVRQLAVLGTDGKFIRPDLTVYVNGLPLAVIELKDPASPQADLWGAIDQLGRYLRQAPDLFVPNLLLVASDGLLTRVGSITSGRSRFMPWRPAEGGEPPWRP